MSNEKSKLSKYLWISNGFLVLLICLFVLYNILRTIDFGNKDIQGGVIVGEEKQEAKEKNLQLQTIRYSKPSSMLNTDYKMIRIDQTDYEIPKEVLEIAKRANDFSYGVTINAIIFNEQKNDYRLILDKIACIKRLDAPFWKMDSLQTVIIYDIAFDDTNDDGLISRRDIGEIYISKLNGKDFRKIAPDSLTVIDYEFTRDHKGIYLQCLKIEKNTSIPREHWDQVSGYYDVEKYQFILDSKLNKLIDRAKELLVN